MLLRSPSRLAALAALLLVLLALGWWGYGVMKKRELQSTVLALVGDATERLNDVLRPRAPAEGNLQRLDSHFKALEASLARFASLEIARHAVLANASQRYLEEVHALLRRSIAEQRGADAVRTAADSLAAHMGQPRGRSGAWISQAVALKQAMEREFFEYRLAAGGLEKSLQAIREARDRLAPLVAPMPLIEDRVVFEARERHGAESAALARQVEAARKLAAPP